MEMKLIGERTTSTWHQISVKVVFRCRLRRANLLSLVSQKMRPFLPLLLVCCAWTASGYNCDNDQMTNGDRSTILMAINDYRSQLARGLANLPDGSAMPKGKDIYELKYNCQLEKQAQKWIDNCKLITSSEDDRKNPETSEIAGETTYGSRTPDVSTHDVLIEATESWWKQLEAEGGISPANLKYTESSHEKKGNLVTMVWGKTTEVGCAVAHCPDVTIASCQYTDAGNVISHNVYNEGEPCGAGSCATFPGSTCDSASGLCQSPEKSGKNMKPAVAETTTESDGNAIISNPVAVIATYVVGAVTIRLGFLA